MDKKAKCKELMLKYLGPASAAVVDQMKDEECVEKCRLKIKMLFGEDRAKEFDIIK